MFTTIEELRKQYITGKVKLLQDEYLGKDGLPYCKNCKEPRYVIVEGNICAKCLCSCQTEKRNIEEYNKKCAKLADELNKRKRLSLLGERYSKATFKEAIITENNRKAYRQCYNYTKNVNDILANNIGIYIYGNNSSGKTHLTACMCNELVTKGYRCIYTNIAHIIRELSGFEVYNSDLMDKLEYYDFVFIDDFGKEFLSREYNASTMKWAEQKLFDIINSRYNSKKPVIFSSNYSIAELENILKLDIAIIERINEMTARVIHLQGDDFRSLIIDKKSDIAKKLGV